MPDQPSWISRAPEILNEIQKPGPALLDRPSIERIFGLSPRQANRLLRGSAGSYLVGRSILIGRKDLAEMVRQRCRTGSPGHEVNRRRRLYESLADARDEAARRRIVIPAKQDVFERRFEDLPAGVSFQPGVLQICFHSPVDLLEKLFELAQALNNDLGRLEEFV